MNPSSNQGMLLLPDSGYVIIPAFREEAVIAGVVRSLVEYGFSVVVVDDGSGDHTGERARDAGALVIRHEINLGQGAALETGMEWARRQQAAWVAHFDADGQHQPEDLLQMLTRLPEADVIMGSRFLPGAATPGIPGSRRWMLRFAATLQSWVTGVSLTDAHCGLRVLGKNALEKIRLEESGMAHATEIVSEIRRHRLSVMEHPVTVHYSTYSLQKGQSGLQAIRILGSLIARRLF